MFLIAPRLIPATLPQDEQRRVWIVQSAIMDLDGYVTDFSSALALFDFASGNPNLPHRWDLIAARDGAMTIKHFYDVFDGIRVTTRCCPSLSPLVDWAQIRTAERVYRTHFRDYIDVRDSVGHAGDKAATPEKYENHAYTGSLSSGPVKGSMVGMTMTNLLEGRKFTNTWEHKIVSYEISNKTLGYLCEARDHVWSAFRVAERELRSAAVEFWKAKSATPSKPDEPPT